MENEKPGEMNPLTCVILEEKNPLTCVILSEAKNLLVSVGVADKRMRPRSDSSLRSE